MGVLDGVKVLEIAGIGPGPFCGMLLADMGADVLRIDRKTGSTVGVDIPFDATKDALSRGRRSLALDLKDPASRDTVLQLVERADVLFEGFRPGVMERLGLGPDVCMDRNKRLVYGRMTGWGQTGPLSQRAGHDINYVGLSGALFMIGRRGQKPVPPSNLVGDFGGGGMLLAVGILGALFESSRSGRGQVVDASMVEGASLLMAMHHSMRAMGIVREERGVNSTDCGAHFNDVYETSDGKFMAVGAAEPAYYQEFLCGLGLDAEAFGDQWNRDEWSGFQQRVGEVFIKRSQAEWCEIFDGTDACVTPVLAPLEARNHPHNRERAAFIELHGVVQPAPAPRFSRTPSEVVRPPPMLGQGGREALREWGVDCDPVPGN